MFFWRNPKTYEGLATSLAFWANLMACIAESDEFMSELSVSESYFGMTIMVFALDILGTSSSSFTNGKFNSVIFDFAKVLKFINFRGYFVKLFGDLIKYM